MSNSNNNTQSNTPAVDFVQAAIEAQKENRKAKNWKESELSKAKKARNLELKIVDEACAETVKDLDNVIQIAQIKLAFEAKKLEIRAAHEPSIKALRIALEDITQGGGMVAGEKIGAVVAPVSKAVTGFWGSLKQRATK